MSNELNGIGSGLSITRASLAEKLRQASATTRSDAFSAIMAETLARQSEGDILAAAVSAAQQTAASGVSAYAAPVVSPYADGAESLLGRTVTAYALIGGETSPQTITGVVQAVYLEDGQTFLSVDGYKVSPANVINAAQTANAVSAYAATTANASSYASVESLVGSLVTYPSYDTYGNVAYLQGTVTNEFTYNGVDYVTVDGLDVELSAITSPLSGANSIYDDPQTTSKSVNNTPYGIVYMPPLDHANAAFLDYVESVTVKAVNMSEDLRWLLSMIEKDPGMLLEGEFDVPGEPDEFGAYG